MSSLARIISAGLKATDRDVELHDCSLLLGPVGAGKSSVLDAIRFVALGYVPALGKAEAATARLLRNGGMEVRAVLSDGRTFSRALKRSRGALKGEAFASWLEGAKTTEASEAIRSLFGESAIEAAECLDLRVLLNASGPERARRIEALLDASGLPAAEQARRVGALLSLRLAAIDAARFPGDTDGLERLAAGVVELIPTEIRNVARRVAAEVSALVEQSLQVAEERCKAKKLEAAARHRSQSAARGEIEDRAVARQSGPALGVADLEKRHAAALEARARAQRDMDEHQRTATARTEAERILPALREDVATAERAHQAALEALPRAERAQAEAAAIVDPPPVEMPPQVPPDPAQIAEAERLRALAAEELGKANSGIPEPLSCEAEERALFLARERLTNAEGSPWRRVEDIAGRIAGVDGCRGDAAELRELARKHGGDTTALEQAALAAEAAFEAAHTAAQERNALRESRRLEIESIGKAAAAYCEQAQALETAAFGHADTTNEAGLAAYLAARHVYDQERQANGLRRGALEAEARHILETAREAQAALDAARAQLNAAEARLAGIASVAVDAGAAQATIREADQVLADTADALKLAREQEARRAEMRALLEEIAAAEAEQKAYAAAEWACQQVRAQDVAARAGGLESRMLRFLRAAGRSEVPFIRAQKQETSFGWRRGEIEIHVEALSGGEGVLFSTALAAAVVAMRSAAVKVLLVEAAEAGSGDVARALLAGCQAVSDECQILVATNSPIQAPEGWTVHDMTAQEVAVT